MERAWKTRKNNQMKMTYWLLVGMLSAAPAPAQRDNVTHKDVPRKADGKPNLSAPAPRGPDGNPDLA